MNQTSLVGRPLAALTAAVVGFAERRGVWSGPLTSSSPELARLWAAPAISTGMNVNETTAYTYSVFWACVNDISTDIASFPLMLYKRETDGGKTLLRDHKLFPLLHDSPNPEMSAFTFRGLLTSHALTCGMGYAEVVRDGMGRVVQLWPITPDRVNVQRETHPPYRVYYDVSRQDGGIDRLSPDEMFVLPGSTVDGVYGRNIISMARESIGLGLAAERFGGTFFGNGATFGGVFEHPNRMSEPAQKNFRESVNAQHQGVDRAHKFIIAEEGMKYQKLGIDPNAAQFIETRQHQVEEMCRWFRMPPHKVQHLIRTSYNSVEQLNIEYTSDTLLPNCVRWEQEILRQLIAPSERRIQFVKHTMDSKLRGDTVSRYEAYAKGIQFGFFSADDVREKEDMNPLPNGQGKVYLVPQNMAPADRLNDIINKQVAPTPAPVAPQPTAPAANRADDAAQMVDLIRTALVDVEDRIVNVTTKIAVIERDKEQFRESAHTSDAEVTRLRSVLAAAQSEENRLKAVLLEATERADRLALEQEALKLSVKAAEERVTAANDVIAKTAEQFETARAATLVLDGECSNLKTACAVATVQVETLTADHAAAVLALQTAADTDRAAAEQRVVELRASVTEAEQQRDTHQATLLTLQAALADAKTQAVTLSGELDTLRAQATAAESLATAERAAAETACAETMALRASADQQATEQTARLAQEQAARAELETTLERIRAEASASATRAGTAQASADSASAETLALRTASEQAATAHAAQLAIEQAEKAAIQAELDTRKQAEAARTQGLLTAHRDLVLDVMARLIWKETERARKNKGTPEKLKAWAESFYLLHEDTCVDALRPAMRTHLALIGSRDDVDAYTRARVHPQLIEAVKQLRMVADGAPEEYDVTLERLLTRWVTDRPAALADLVLQAEVDYLRSQGSTPPHVDTIAPTGGSVLPPIHIDVHNYQGGGGGSKKVTFKRNVDGSTDGAVIEDGDD